MEPRAVIVPPGQGHRVGNVEFLARTVDTPRFTFGIIEIAPGRVLEEHVHPDEDDAFYIVEGELTFMLGDRQAAAPPGTFVLVPPGVEHGFRNNGTRPVRMLNIHAPAGFDRRIGLADAEKNSELFQRMRTQLSERRTLDRELLADDAEWVNPDDAVETGSRRGADSFLQAIASVFEGWEESVFEIERMIESGDDVIALGQLQTRGRAAGIQASGPHGEIWTFTNGKVSRMQWFQTHAETLAAAGVRDATGQAPSP